ncbi:MAG: NADH:ubiquinone reductase (Na(+)-transporting) subunit F [Candidatus Algichlamydia australiensis]|nr:NADH:ubiquinone reductase (Na(+)-transporting) subunit F [Chlamydiales bacterium]
MDLILLLISSLSFVGIGLILSFMILGVRRYLVSTKPCKLKINEDEELTKEVSAGQTLLSALLSQGIAVPSPCGGKATCKQCKVQIVNSSNDILETDKATFSYHQLKEGWRLSCQCKVKEDMELKIPESLLTLKEFKGKVVSNQNVATFIKELIIEIPKDAIESYQPGDYLQFHVPPFVTNTSEWKGTMEEKYFADWEKFQLFDTKIDFGSFDEEVIRAYSMASYPGEEHLKFNIRIATPPAKNVPWGICSSYTFSLKPGDEVRLSGPFGESHMIHDDRELIFLIGGAGSSFGRSHILDLFHNKKTKRKVTLWYGARSIKENIYEEEFRALDAEHENFSYRLVLSEPTDEDKAGGWPVDDPEQTGFLFKAFEIGQLEKMNEPENCLYYVCGPPMHNQSVMKLLDNYGVERENIVLDDFGS